MAEVEITYEYIQKAAQHPDVVKQLQIIADRVAARARELAADKDLDVEVTTQAGVRPKGRPYVNVLVDDADQEFGTDRKPRFRILGRAAEGG